MKTVIHANVDGYEIVLGFGEAFSLIDPVATAAKIAPLLMKCPEQKRWNALDQSKGTERLKLENPELAEALATARQKLIEANAVYVRPPQGEELIPDTQASDLQAKHEARGERRQLLLSGGYLADWRGIVCWRKVSGSWAREEIAALGIEPPADAIPEDKLTDAQRAEIADQQEAERVATLSPEDRATETRRKEAAERARAARRRSELEIMGVQEEGGKV